MSRSKLTLFALLFSACSSQFQVENTQAELDLGTYSNPEENTFYQLVNSFRRELKLQPVRMDARLNEAARKHSGWMMGIGILTHVGPTLNGSSFTRVIYEGVDANATIAENIARGNFNAHETFLQWLLSPSHLSAMIDPQFDHIGIARSECDEDQTWYCFWTTDFAQLDEPTHLDREFTDEEVARAAEAILGPLGEARDEIFVEGDDSPSRWQWLKDRFGLSGEL